MKMPDKIEDPMLAPCGMNCAVCYKHVSIRKRGKACGGCLVNDFGKPEHCRKCDIKSCAQGKGYVHCFKCAEFPCKLIKTMDKRYTDRYNVSLVENGKTANEKGVSAFLAEDRQKWTCSKCGGAFSLHDNACSECENADPA